MELFMEQKFWRNRNDTETAKCEYPIRRGCVRNPTDVTSHHAFTMNKSPSMQTSSMSPLNITHVGIKLNGCHGFIGPRAGSFPDALFLEVGDGTAA
jgi:hypothetical protein